MQLQKRFCDVTVSLSTPLWQPVTRTSLGPPPCSICTHIRWELFLSHFNVAFLIVWIHVTSLYKHPVCLHVSSLYKHPVCSVCSQITRHSPVSSHFCTIDHLCFTWHRKVLICESHTILYKHPVCIITIWTPCWSSLLYLAPQSVEMLRMLRSESHTILRVRKTLMVSGE